MTRLKLITVLLLTIIVSSLSYAQNGKDQRYKDNQPLERRPGLFRFFTGWRDRDSNDAKKFDRFFVDITHNNLHGDKNGMAAKWYSLGFNASFMWDKPFSKTSPVGIGLGLGYSHMSMHNNGHFSFVDEGNNGKTDYTSLNRLPDSVMSGRSVNKIAMNYIEIPFEFRFRNKGKVMFKFYPGFKVGVLASMYQKSYDKDGSPRIKDFGFPDENRWSYGPTLRIGINQVFLFGYYNLAPMFTSGDSNRLNVFSFGISIGMFSEKRVN